MANWFSRSSTGRGGDFWPVLLLVVVVMVPTIGVLWFVGLATRNEHLANRQRLTDAYLINLTQIQRDIEAQWSNSTGSREALVIRPDLLTPPLQPQLLFDLAVDNQWVDAVVCLTEDGDVEYPTLPDAVATTFDDPTWTRASKLEHEMADADEALTLYRQIANSSADETLAAFASQAIVRCLFRLDRQNEAIDVVESRFGDRFSNVLDAQGRVIAANVELMAIESTTDHSACEAILNRLVDRIRGDRAGRLPAFQRLFLMKRLSTLGIASVDTRRADAESLASQFVSVHPKPVRPPVLQSSQIPDVWQVATDDNRLLLLLKTNQIKDRLATIAADVELPKGVQLTIQSPSQTHDDQELVSIQAGRQFPGWRLALNDADGQVDQSASHHQTLYRWTSLLVILFTSALAIFIAISFRRQIRVANLKNDLVGTVSHELKTPLSSMRLLVDTLLESDKFDETQTRDYLELISKENSRLSRLIEKFLTFSRLEKGKHAFEFRELDVNELAAMTLDAAGDRYESPGCTLTVTVAEDSPTIHADADALMTALLNFLDNGYKYSSDPRELSLNIFPDGQSVCFAVSDNGEGLSRAAARKVFQKFYQVDQSLVREGQGCGLGLSIVSSIAEAHGGNVSVSSQLNQGSTFTLRIPIEHVKAVV